MGNRASKVLRRGPPAVSGVPGREHRHLAQRQEVREARVVSTWKSIIYFVELLFTRRDYKQVAPVQRPPGQAVVFIAKKIVVAVRCVRR